MLVNGFAGRFIDGIDEMDIDVLNTSVRELAQWYILCWLSCQ